MSTPASGNLYDELSFIPNEMADHPGYNKLNWTQNFELDRESKPPRPSKKPVIVAIVVTVLLIYAVLCSAAVIYVLTEIVRLKVETAAIQMRISSQTNVSALEVNNEGIYKRS